MIMMMMMMMMREKGRRCTKGVFTSLPLPRGSPPRYFLLKTTFEILHLFSSARLAYSLDLYFSKYYPRNVQWILARISWDGPEVSTQAEKSSWILPLEPDCHGLKHGAGHGTTPRECHLNKHFFSREGWGKYIRVALESFILRDYKSDFSISKIGGRSRLLSKNWKVWKSKHWIRNLNQF